MSKPLLRILFFPVGKPPVVLLIKNDFKEYQRLVEGFYDSCRLDRDICLYCNDEALLNGMAAPNLMAIGPAYAGNPIHGPAFVVGFQANGEDRSLTDQEIVKWKQLPRLTAVTEGQS